MNATQQRRTNPEIALAGGRGRDRAPQRSAVCGRMLIAATLLAINSIASAQPGGLAGRDAAWRQERVASLVGLTLPQGGIDAGLRCVETNGVSILFAPGATRADVAATLDRLPDDALDFFVTDTRWTFTATDGVLTEGQPFTLTYSFVDDGVDVPGFNGEPAAPSNLRATADAEFPGGFAAFKQVLRGALERWGAVTNITFVEVADDGLPLSRFTIGQLPDANSVGRGDIRIAGHAVGGAVLAYNSYPAFGGDMVIDTTKFDTLANPTNGFRALFNVIAHESGHGLALHHSDPQAGIKLMEPALNLGFEGPQEDDLRGIYHLYGDRDEQNDAMGDEVFLGGPLRDPAQGTMTLVRDEVAIERAGASDWYAFTAFAGVPVSVRLDPVGTIYQAGPQGGTLEAIDGSAARNLGFRLYRRVSAQTNQLSLLAEIDLNEAGTAEVLPPLPFTLAGYMVVEVFADDNVDDSQRYRLTISNAEIINPDEIPVLRVFDGATELGDSSSVTMDDTTVSESSNHQIVISNGGGGTLELGPVTIAGPGAADYAFTLLGDQVQPSGQANLLIGFTPSAEGQRVAVISIPNNDPDRSDFSFIVRGTGTPGPEPEMVVEHADTPVGRGDTVALPPSLENQTTTVELDIRNTGDAELVVDGVTAIPRFTGSADQRFATPLSVPAGGVRTVAFDVTAEQTGVLNLDVQIASNDAERFFPFKFELTVAADCDGDGVDDATQIDTDGDGLIDACDACPNGEDQIDSDGDGTDDCADNFPNDPFDGQGDPNAAGQAGNEDNGNTDNGNAGNGNADVPAVDPQDPQAGDPNDGQRVTPDDEQVDDPNAANGEVLDEDIEEMVQPFGLCGFGAGFASLMSLMSLAGTRGVRQHRRRSAVSDQPSAVSDQPAAGSRQ